jgi:Mg2+/Co2+ transporter CorB
METPLVLHVLAIAVLLVLSGFFSGSETALTAASPARIHHLERRGNKRARIVEDLLTRRGRLLGAILLGNNLVNILASALATSVLIGLAGEAGVVYATVIMTGLVLIFAEVLPKTYAISHADRMALAAAPVVRWVVMVLSPVSRTVEVVVGLTLRLFGADKGKHGALVSGAEELRGVIELSGKEGDIVKHERDMLGSILDLADVEVSEIMIHRKQMEMIDAVQTPSRIVELVVASPHTRIPLWRDEPENIIGVLHAKDLLRAVRAHAGDIDRLNVTAIATPPWFVPETTTLRTQLNAFLRRHVHFAMVVDEYGAIMGLVTLEDILEEIVGEISDEFDVPVTGVRRQPDGAYVVKGTVTIRDLNRQFDWRLPDEEASTIAGLVIHEAQLIPEVGQVFTFHDFKFEILRRQRNQVTTLRITPPGDAGAPSAA